MSTPGGESLSHPTQTPIVLGLPWLQLHSPHVDWASGQILAWGPSCFSSCLSKVTHKERLPVATTSVSSDLPTAYSDYRDVFCKKSAEVLPPHRSFDCAIDLVPGATLPRGHTYLSVHLRDPVSYTHLTLPTKLAV